MQEVQTAKYRITGLVDVMDEQGNITGQLPIGSVQELPVEVGIKAVEEGRAEAVADEEAEVATGGSAAPTGETAEAEAPTGETGPADNGDASNGNGGGDDAEKGDEVE